MGFFGNVYFKKGKQHGLVATSDVANVPCGIQLVSWHSRVSPRGAYSALAWQQVCTCCFVTTYAGQQSQGVVRANDVLRPFQMAKIVFQFISNEL